MLIGFALYFSVPAHADPVSDYARVAAPAVCATLDRYPTLAGVLGVGEGIVYDTGGRFGYYEAGEIIGWSVFSVCPRHIALLQRFIAVYGQGYVA
jgi:hypothetical protein